jgi:signal transduction histidine kinase
MVGEQHYQQEALSALLLWTIRIGPVAALLNMIGFLADPAWTTVVGSAGVVALVMFALWCLKLVQRGQTRRAAQMFNISGMAIMAVVIFIAARNEVLLGAMGMSVFVVIATFFEPPESAMRWGVLSALLYEAGFLARSLDPSRDLGVRVDIVSLYIVPPVILCFLALAGRIMSEHLNRALRASEAAGNDLARSYVEVELRVAERTHELVKERYLLNNALRELTAAHDQAEAASRAKSAFLANMSHELRTPLTTILGYAGLVAQHEQVAADPRLRSDLDRISMAGTHLLELISDVLDLAHAEASTIELHQDSFDVAALIDEVTAVVRPAIKQNSNMLEVYCDQQLGAAYLDRAKVRLILLNLLSNAAKFTEHGTITLRAWLETQGSSVADSQPPSLQPPASSLFTFEVADTGIGIAPDQLPNLFQPFVKGDTGDQHAYSGTGLGLTICQRFCELMDGDLLVSSQAGQGSTFTVRLPAGPVHPAQPDTPIVALDRSHCSINQND